MYEAAARMMGGDGEAILLYVGDHDPSGEDMVRDIRERLLRFGVSDLKIRKIALTWDQIKLYKPPPNPAILLQTLHYVSEFSRNFQFIASIVCSARY